MHEKQPHEPSATQWARELADELAAAGDDPALAGHYSTALSPGYPEETGVRQQADDIRRLERLSPHSIEADLAGESSIRLRLFACQQPVTLSQILPILQSMDIDVLDEHPHPIVRSDGTQCWIYDLGLAAGPSTRSDPLHSDREFQARVVDSFIAIWTQRTEADGLNCLVRHADLDWRQIAVLRAYVAYLRQIGLPHSRTVVRKILLENPSTTADLIRLFAYRFDPETTASRDLTEDALHARIVKAINAVAGIDEDRILRALLSLIDATTRTNHYRTDPGDSRRALAFKFDPELISELPLPRPRFEIFVHSPRVEGVHLRFGLVARGGLRWSDRRDDFRTEILALAKAQAVKNAVIVPAGAKGGFVVKQPPPSGGVAPGAHSEAVQAEGMACYTEFVSALLDLTDNLDHASRRIVSPSRVVRRDGDDFYLVVAADKGTATFSDVANSIAIKRKYWLDDAFASGGSIGYDHKTMGITARGAWESVRRHFRELGTDTQTEDFTVIGVGDMSGDVFGNGMLLSRHIRLVAAFDHRHIFIDPTPEPESSYGERARLFALGRSSWADYDTTLLSPGGMVIPRSAKSVHVNDATRLALHIDNNVTNLSTPALIRAILRAPADLLWSGGIGTYVKSGSQSHADAGDKGNDPLRVNGSELRVRVVGEGGNLGLTQLGRIEFARAGGQINTDAMDNSAGVDCSDHEVNIKIPMDFQTSAGRLPEQDRRALLSAMTQEVTDLVLADNIAQNELMGLNRRESRDMAGFHARLADHLEATRALNRTVESLPTPATFASLERSGSGLTSPELAHLTAHVKLALKDEILASDVPDSGAFQHRLADYFPAQMRTRFKSALEEHPLRRQIITTSIVNDMVNTAGMTYAFRLREETGTSGADAAKAYECVTQIFGLDEIFAEIRGTADSVPPEATDELRVQTQRVIDRASRWLIANRPQPATPAAEIQRYASRIQDHAPLVRKWLSEEEHDAVERRSLALTNLGAPRELSARVAELLHVYCFLDIADIADIANRDFVEVAELYFALSSRLHVNRYLTAVSQLDRRDRWQALARLALREDLYCSLRAVTLDVISGTEPGLDVSEKVAQWELSNSARLQRARMLLSELSAETQAEPALPTLSVTVRRIRSMVRTPEPQI
jgi:glutamate dehydrogenase